MKPPDPSEHLREWMKLIPEHGFSQAFVLMDEAASCRLVSKLGLINPDSVANFANNIEDEQVRKRVANGGLLSYLFRLEDLKQDIKQYIPANESFPHFALGASWVASYNAGCWWMPNGEYAIIVDAFLLLCLFAFSDILIRNSGHVYVDIGFEDDDDGRLEDDILRERAVNCAREFADYFDSVVNSYPSLDFMTRLFQQSDASSTKGLTCWDMGRGFLRTIVAHELGHISQVYRSGVKGYKHPVEVRTIDFGIECHKREFDADVFAIDMFKEHSGQIVFFDYLIRLTLVFFIATSGLDKTLSTSTHPALRDRLVNVLDYAVRNDIIKNNVAHNIASNFNTWIPAIIDVLVKESRHRLQKWHDSWLSTLP